MEESSRLSQVTYIPCSVSQQKGLHFPESAPAGYFSQFNSGHFIAGYSAVTCSHPQLFSRERCLSAALCAAAEINHRAGWTLSSLIRACFSRTLVCVRLCGRDTESKRRADKTRSVYRERDSEMGEEITTGMPEVPTLRLLKTNLPTLKSQNFKTPSPPECS